jgi:Lon protease-like protein
MKTKHESDASLATFSGTAPLFPLPGVALYPQVVQPLHVFEPRYRMLASAALEGERLIAMAVLKPGWEPRYEDKHVPIHPVVCLARIALDQQLPDGRSVLLLRGACRARVLREPDGDLPYRTADLQVLSDVYPHQPAIDRERRRVELRELFCELYPKFGASPPLARLLQGELSLGVLCDLLAHALALPADAAFEVLAELNVDARSDLILGQLRERCRKLRAADGQLRFPPAFSKN